MPELDYGDATRQVAAVQRQLDETVASIRADKSLTDLGRRRQIAAATLAAKERVSQHRQEHAAARAEQRRAAERIAFGRYGGDSTGADRMSARDAADRAARLGSHDDAAAALSQAILLDDEDYAKAVAAQSYRRGWTDVTARYGAEYGVSTFIDEMDSLPEGPKTALADQIAFRVRPPNELRGATDQDLQRLASTEVGG